MTEEDVAVNCHQFPRKVIQGLCGWSCASLIKCKKFFPPLISQSSSSEKLHFLSRRGGTGCVEVNSSTYAIPSPVTVASWVKATSKPFTFHFKAFGLFCGSKVAGRSLPNTLRVRHRLQAERSYSYDSLPTEAVDDLWALFNDCLTPVVQANKMGAVVFQFHLNFVPSDDNRLFIEACAKNLRQDVKMAVEFRDRSWFFTENIASLGRDCIGRELNWSSAPDRLEHTCKWMKETLNCFRAGNGGVVLVASEDLYREVYPSDTQGSLPTVLSAFSTPDLAYIRVHRREGNNRVLRPEEIQRWVAAITALMEERMQDDSCGISASIGSSNNSRNSSSDGNCCNCSKGQTDNSSAALRGSCYVLWGTDYEDHPILNMRHLQDALPAAYRVDWRGLFAQPGGGGISALFANQQGKKRKEMLEKQEKQEKQEQKEEIWCCEGMKTETDETVASIQHQPSSIMIDTTIDTDTASAATTGGNILYTAKKGTLSPPLPIPLPPPALFSSSSSSPTTSATSSSSLVPPSSSSPSSLVSLTSKKRRPDTTPTGTTTTAESVPKKQKRKNTIDMFFVKKSI